MTPRHLPRAGLALLAAAVMGCATGPGSEQMDQDFQAMMKASFRSEGIATVDRIEQDADQAACSASRQATASETQRIEAEARATIHPPSDGKYLGDWREGEKLAQNGRGMTWTDKSAAPAANGGNCYNCHQITKAEISYGTIGPSLYHYGKNRGVTDTASPTAKPIVEYTWTKLWNAKAYNACSGMPRFGHGGLLDEKQLKDLMALILDPRSPVNQ